jgi:5'-nucleotidase/UDP-sugar diphosphatase
MIREVRNDRERPKREEIGMRSEERVVKLKVKSEKLNLNMEYMMLRCILGNFFSLEGRRLSLPCIEWYMDEGDRYKRIERMKSKMVRKSILVMFLMLLVAGLSRAHEKVVILYTNDMMGHLRGEPAYFINRDFPPPLGNASSCATYIEREREKAKKEHCKFMLLDAGNCFGNPVLGDLEVGKTVEYMNFVGYDACAIGIYDTRLGREKLTDIINKSNFPRLSANLRIKESDKCFSKSYTTMEYKDIKFGIFGLTSEYGPIWVEKDIDKQFDYDREKPKIEEMVRLLKESGCDIIIGLTNIGFVHDSLLVDSIPGIDVIIGGGEGRGMSEPYESGISHTIICRTYGNLSSIGRLELIIDEKTKRIVAHKGENITLFEEQFPPNRVIQKLLRE